MNLFSLTFSKIHPSLAGERRNFVPYSVDYMQNNDKGGLYGNEIIGENGLAVEDILRGVQRLEFTKREFHEGFYGKEEDRKLL